MRVSPCRDFDQTRSERLFFFFQLLASSSSGGERSCSSLKLMLTLVLRLRPPPRASLPFVLVVSQMDLAERVVSLARGRYDDATALVVVFE